MAERGERWAPAPQGGPEEGEQALPLIALFPSLHTTVWLLWLCMGHTLGAAPEGDAEEGEQWQRLTPPLQEAPAGSGSQESTMPSAQCCAVPHLPGSDSSWSAHQNKFQSSEACHLMVPPATAAWPRPAVHRALIAGHRPGGLLLLLHLAGLLSRYCWLAAGNQVPLEHVLQPGQSWPANCRIAWARATTHLQLPEHSPNPVACQ